MKVFVYIVLLLGFTCINNIKYTIDYNERFVPSNFSREKVFDEKYSCIKYFDEQTYLKFIDRKCQKYKHDYVIFELEKSLHVYNYIVYNLVHIIILSPILFI